MKNKPVDQIMKELRAPFKESELEYRVGATNRDKTMGLALAYVEARAIQNRLDQVVGFINWKVAYKEIQGGFLCTLSLKVGDEWISKQDGAPVTEFESVKGGISSAFKRVASSGWGLGRYLYDLRNNWFPIEQKGNSYYFKVKLKISVNAEVVTEEKPEIKPMTVRTAVSPMKCSEKPYNKTFKLTFGKYKGMSIEQLYVKDRGYFMWLLNNGKTANVVRACRDFVEKFV